MDSRSCVRQTSLVFGDHPYVATPYIGYGLPNAQRSQWSPCCGKDTFGNHGQTSEASRSGLWQLWHHKDISQREHQSHEREHLPR